MSNKDREIRDAIQKLAGTYRMFPVKFVDCTVVSVDKKSRTCIVNIINGDCDNLKVRIMSEISDGVFIYPSEDSTVSVCFTDITEPIIVNQSWIDEHSIIVGKQEHQILPDKQIFNDGKYGGLATVKNGDVSNGGLLKRYNLLEEDNNKLRQQLDLIKTAAQTAVAITSTWTAGVPLLDTAANSALTPFFNVIISSLTPYINPKLEKTTEDMISNPNITHGKSL